MTYEFIYEFMYMKNIVKSYLNSCVPRFQMKLPCSLSHSPCPLGHALGPGAARYNQLSLAINNWGQICRSESSLMTADYMGCSRELCPWHHCTGSLFIARELVISGLAPGRSPEGTGIRSSCCSSSDSWRQA